MEKVLTNNNRENDGYNKFEKLVIDTFDERSNKPLFKVQVSDLFDTFLENIPEEGRQHYNCNTCKSFINRYGNLVIINDDYSITSAIWNSDKTPEFFKPAVKAMEKRIKREKIQNIFVTNKTDLGVYVCGGHSHLCVKYGCNPNKFMEGDRISDILSESLEKFKMLNNAISAYSIDITKQAVILLETNSLYRSDKCLAIAIAFDDLLIKFNNTKNELERDRMIWEYIEDAPTGACHIKSGMIGTLLDDIKDGLDFDSIASRFANKMDPLHYMRPTKDVSTGNVQRANELFEELGLESALNRRFADITELQYIWKPDKKEHIEEDKPKGLFDSLIDKEEEKQPTNIGIPEITTTWVKFYKDVLPKIDRIFVQSGYDQYKIVFITAVDPEANPIIKWDKKELRNPLSIYMYNQSTLPSFWNIKNGYNEVYGISLLPESYNKEYKPNIDNFVFVIEGMKDTNSQNYNCGLGLFPEILIPELREVRSTIEAYSNKGKLSGYDEYSACGIVMHRNTHLKVITKEGVELKYNIDRLE